MPASPPDIPHIRADALPILDHLGTGSQSHVFGDASWAVKIPRRSLLRVVSLFVRKRSWIEAVALGAGDCVLPFCRIDNVAFRGPSVVASWSDGRAAPGTEKVYRAREGTVIPRVPSDAFLDTRFYAANARDAIVLLEQLLARLEQLQQSGFYMLDFIMKNFVFYGDKLVVVDPGLIVPLHLLRWQPTVAITSRQFRHWLLRDYDALLVKKMQQADPDDRAVLDVFRTDFATRVTRLARKSIHPKAHHEKVAIHFPEDLRRSAEHALCY